MCLVGQPEPEEVDLLLPDGSSVTLPLVYVRKRREGAEAAARKDAGDDPDVTDGTTVVTSVCWGKGEDIIFVAGEGVGTVTKPGLTVPPGDPAINPVPREMITRAVREVTDGGVRVTVSIPGGQELAEKTFNPRLGIVGGLSILGTTGRVRPFSSPALREALRCSLDVAAACGVLAPALVPGHIGERAARRHFCLSDEQVIEVSNEWGFVLDCLEPCGFTRILVLGHPGKLIKLAVHQWDTHSSRSANAASILSDFGEKKLGRRLPAALTAEGLFAALARKEREQLGRTMAREIRKAVVDRLGGSLEVATVLINMKGDVLGSDGDLTPWKGPDERL
jgi:cobalt-precorrin-5B (C1)-methyltransferase